MLPTLFYTKTKDISAVIVLLEMINIITLDALPNDLPYACREVPLENA